MTGDRDVAAARIEGRGGQVDALVERCVIARGVEVRIADVGISQREIAAAEPDVAAVCGERNATAAVSSEADAAPAVGIAVGIEDDVEQVTCGRVGGLLDGCAGGKD